MDAAQQAKLDVEHIIQDYIVQWVGHCGLWTMAQQDLRGKPHVADEIG